MAEKECPICLGEYHYTAASAKVCEEHMDTFIVTKCVFCGKNSFAEESGICPNCEVGVSARLREIGVE